MRAGVNADAGAHEEGTCRAGAHRDAGANADAGAHPDDIAAPSHLGSGGAAAEDRERVGVIADADAPHTTNVAPPPSASGGDDSLDSGAAAVPPRAAAAPTESFANLRAGAHAGTSAHQDNVTAAAHASVAAAAERCERVGVIADVDAPHFGIVAPPHSSSGGADRRDSGVAVVHPRAAAAPTESFANLRAAAQASAAAATRSSERVGAHAGADAPHPTCPAPSHSSSGGAEGRDSGAAAVHPRAAAAPTESFFDLRAGAHAGTSAHQDHDAAAAHASAAAAEHQRVRVGANVQGVDAPREKSVAPPHLPSGGVGEGGSGAAKRTESLLNLRAGVNADAGAHEEGTCRAGAHRDAGAAGQRCMRPAAEHASSAAAKLGPLGGPEQHVNGGAASSTPAPIGRSRPRHHNGTGDPGAPKRTGSFRNLRAGVNADAGAQEEGGRRAGVHRDAGAADERCVRPAAEQASSAAAKLWLGGANDDGVGGPGQHADGGAASSASPPLGSTRPRHQRDIAASSPAYGDDADAEKSRRAGVHRDVRETAPEAPRRAAAKTHATAAYLGRVGDDADAGIARETSLADAARMPPSPTRRQQPRRQQDDSQPPRGNIAAASPLAQPAHTHDDTGNSHQATTTADTDTYLDDADDDSMDGDDSDDDDDSAYSDAHDTTSISTDIPAAPTTSTSAPTSRAASSRLVAERAPTRRDGHTYPSRVVVGDDADAGIARETSLADAARMPPSPTRRQQPRRQQDDSQPPRGNIAAASPLAQPAHTHDDTGNSHQATTTADTDTYLDDADDDSMDGDDSDDDDDSAYSDAHDTTSISTDIPAAPTTSTSAPTSRAASSRLRGAAPTGTTSTLVSLPVAATPEALAATAPPHDVVLSVYPHSASHFECTLCGHTCRDLTALHAHRRACHRRTRFVDKFTGGCACDTAFDARAAATKHARSCPTAPRAAAAPTVDVPTAAAGAPSPTATVDTSATGTVLASPPPAAACPATVRPPADCGAPTEPPEPAQLPHRIEAVGGKRRRLMRDGEADEAMRPAPTPAPAPAPASIPEPPTVDTVGPTPRPGSDGVGTGTRAGRVGSRPDEDPAPPPTTRTPARAAPRRDGRPRPQPPLADPARDNSVT
ncbi:hypothetical protein ATCC90586_011475 [Pythium insidiosum]|nr:hypothetical protein ATCC90586_011475 [Pythium insidiosum]